MNRFAFAAGAVFALGLAIAGITAPQVVLDAFRVDAGWDPHLWLMFVGSQLAAIPATIALARRGRTLAGARLASPPRRLVDRRLVVGSLVFGVGWGVGGLCPGPQFATAGAGGAHTVLALVGLFAGIALHDAHEAFTRGA